MTVLKTWCGAIAASLLICGASAASAATLTTASCGTATELMAVTLTDIDATGGLSISADKCIYVDGNDINNGGKAKLFAGLQSGDLFNLASSDWSILGKSDDPAPSPVTASNGSVKGDWSIDAGSIIDMFVVTLKAGSNYAAFLFEDVGPGTDFSGKFDFGKLTDNPGFKIDGKTLSHFGAAIADPSDPVVAPLPAAGWMLIAGLGGLGVMRRFRQS